MPDVKFLSNDISLKNKRVILRLDLNVPINNSKIDDDTRIRVIRPFLKKLIKKKSKSNFIIAPWKTKG